MQSGAARAGGVSCPAGLWLPEHAAKSQAVEERDQGVRCPVAAAGCVRAVGLGDRLLLEAEVGVKVDLDGGDLLVAEPERDGRQVDPGSRERTGARVPQGVRSDVLVLQGRALACRSLAVPAD